MSKYAAHAHGIVRPSHPLRGKRVMMSQAMFRSTAFNRYVEKNNLELIATNSLYTKDDTLGVNTIDTMHHLAAATKKLEQDLANTFQTLNIDRLSAGRYTVVCSDYILRLIVKLTDALMNGSQRHEFNNSMSYVYGEIMPNITIAGVVPNCADHEKEEHVQRQIRRMVDHRCFDVDVVDGCLDFRSAEALYNTIHA